MGVVGIVTIKDEAFPTVDTMYMPKPESRVSSVRYIIPRALTTLIGIESGVVRYRSSLTVRTQASTYENAAVD